MEMCLRVLKESNKSRFDRYSRQKQCTQLIISYITFRGCRVHIFPTTFLEIAVNRTKIGSGTTQERGNTQISEISQLLFKSFHIRMLQKEKGRETIVNFIHSFLFFMQSLIFCRSTDTTMPMVLFRVWTTYQCDQKKRDWMSRRKSQILQIDSPYTHRSQQPD